MSGSPKRTQYHLSPEAAQRQRDEKRRRAEERAAKKRAAAEQRRKEAFRREQVRVTESVTKVQQEAATFRQSPAGRCVARSLRQLELKLQQLAASSLANRKVISSVEQQLDQLRGELQQAIVQGRAAYDARLLERESALLLKKKYQVAADRQASQQFDPDGLKNVESMLRQIDSFLDRQNLTAARSRMTELGKTFAQHRAEVDKHRKAVLVKQRKAQAALEALQQTLADLKADTTVQRWAQPAVFELDTRIADVTKAISDSRFEFAMRRIPKLTREAKRILKAAEQQQEAHEEPEFIAETTANALRACGMQVQFVHRKCDDGKEEIVIRASDTEEDWTLDVCVPQAGTIAWYPNGFPRQVVPGTKGQQPASLCDKPVQHIQKVQEELRRQGVETGALTWEGQDPDLPIGAAKSTRSKTPYPSHSRLRRARR